MKSAKENWITIKQNNNTRKIRIITNGSPYNIDAIYGLIKANMIEKVEGY